MNRGFPNMLPCLLLGPLVVLLATASGAGAATLDRNGHLDSCDPTSNRTLPGDPPAGTSAFAPPHYETVTFTVGTAGTYTFTDTSGGEFPEFLELYQTAFVPGSPLTNVLHSDGDSSGTNPNFQEALNTGTTYVLVMTSFGQNTGSYMASITGSGTVSASNTTTTPSCVAPAEIASCDKSFQRPAPGTPPVALTTDSPHYDTVNFTPTVTFSYSFAITSGSGFPASLVLYDGSFDPAAPLQNALTASQSNAGTPSVSRSLTAGQPYVLVISGTAATDLGSYELTINSSGGGQVAIDSTTTVGCPAPSPSLPEQPAPTPTVTPTAQDSTAPNVSVSGIPQSVPFKTLLSGLKPSVTVNEPASLDLTLQGTTKRATVSAFELSLASTSLSRGSGARSVTLKPSAKLVGKPKKAFRVRLHIVATDVAGNRSTADKTITVKPKPRKKAKKARH